MILERLLTYQKKTKVVGYKWDFIVKYKFDGIIERCKVKLVAQGFTKLIMRRHLLLLQNLIQ